LTVFQSITQGVIQGLTEFLPVSSSGHLALYQYLTGMSSESSSLFSLFLHLGTLIAVFIAFWPTIRALIIEAFSMLGDIFRGENIFRDPLPTRRMIYLLFVSLLPLIMTFFIKDWLEGFSSDNSIIAEGVCFMITGTLLFLADACIPGYSKAGTMNYWKALAVGFTQAIAPLPGISRSGSTLSVAVILGLDRTFALNFSFIMGIPAVMGAVLLDLKDILGGALGIEWQIALIGLITSAIFGLMAIKLLRMLVASSKLRIFSAYTFFLGVIVLAIGVIDINFGYPVQGAVMSLFK